MSGSIARTSAVLSATLALAAAAWWMLHGAPDVPDINSPALESSDASIQFFQNGKLTFALVLLSGMHHAWPWFSRAAILLTGVSVMLAAFSSLFLFWRGGRQGYIQRLGCALGWWSLGFGYLWLFSVVRAHGVAPGPVGWRIALDAAAFQLMLAAALATLGFVAEFPRPVPGPELREFLEKLWSRQARVFGGTGAGKRRLRLPLWLAAPVVLGASLFWRPSSLTPDAGTASLLMLAAFVVFCALLASPLFSALRYFRFHRETGGAADRHRIGRLQAVLWRGACAVLVLAALAAAAALIAHMPADLRAGALAGRLLEVCVFALQPVVLLALMAAVSSRIPQRG